MLTIALQAIPKQSLSVVLGALSYDIDVLVTGGCMSMNITRAGEPVVTGQRVVAGQLVIPYSADEANSGNFLFLTQNDALPDYTQFGSTQLLLYASNAELEAVRAAPQVFAVESGVFGAVGTIIGAAVVAGVA